MPLDNFLSKFHLEEWNNTQQRKCILDFTVAWMTQANQKTRTYGKFLKTLFSSTIRQWLEWSALTTVVMSTSSKFLLNTRKGVFTYQDGPYGLFIKLVGKSYQPEKIDLKSLFCDYHSWGCFKSMQQHFFIKGIPVHFSRNFYEVLFYSSPMMKLHLLNQLQGYWNLLIPILFHSFSLL